jgi:hypothetical protein
MAAKKKIGNSKQRKTIKKLNMQGKSLKGQLSGNQGDDQMDSAKQEEPKEDDSNSEATGPNVYAQSRRRGQYSGNWLSAVVDGRKKNMVHFATGE